MKNKEIEVIEKYLNGLISYPFQHKDKEYILSYIEQLEKENKTLGEIIIIKDEQLKEMQMQKTDYTAVNILEAKIEQLENNRDKAIELIEKELKYPPKYLTGYSAIQVLNILKGVSDE